MLKTLVLLNTIILLHPYQIGNDVIPDKKTAVAVAEIILSSRYGYTADRWKPYSVKLINDSIWEVGRDTPHSGMEINGKDTTYIIADIEGPIIQINKKDGRVLYIDYIK
jgi:hypothetical protein